MRRRTRISVNVSQKINGEFTIHEQIGSGFFSKVYRVQDRTGTNRAAKFVSSASKELIERECRVMKRGNGRSSYGAHCWYFFGRHGDYYVLVMDLLGDSIFTLSRRYELSLKSILMIGIQVTRRIETLHNRGFIHRDIKPDNFVIGRNLVDRDCIYLIDYGIACGYLDSNSQHKPRANASQFYGTCDFAPPQSARYERQSRRSDLESLVYCLVYLIKGCLPWTGMSPLEAGALKEQVVAEELCSGLPEELKKYFRDVILLRYSERPNYSKLVSYLETALRKAGHEGDHEFEWSQSTGQ